MNAEKEELLEIYEIGPEIARGLTEFFAEKKNQTEIQDLKKLGVTMEYGKKGGKLAGKTFVFTGALKSFSRNKAKEIVEQLGGTTTSSVSKKVDYVVVGNKPGSKYQKAKEINIPILTEEEFKKIIE